MISLDATLPALYATIAPIFLVVAAGFLSARTGLLSADAIRALAAYAARVAAPVMVFRAIANSEPASLQQPGYLIAYAAGSCLAFAVCALCLRRVTNAQGPALAFGALGGSFGNTLMVGFPLATLLYGDAATVPLALTLLVEVAIVLPLALTLAESRHEHGAAGHHALRRNLLNAARNPLVVGMVLGAVLAWSGLTLPTAVNDGLGLIAQTVAPVGLFVIGGLMVGYRPVGEFARQAIVVPSKLVLHPLAVCLAMWLCGVRDPLLIGPALCFAAGPIFGAYAALSHQYGIGPQSAALMVATTVGAALSMPLVLWSLARLLSA